MAAVWTGLWLLMTQAAQIGPQVASCVLFTLGGCLAMAGSRSHLYQSNNVLAAYLADQIRSAKAVDKS